MGDSVCRAGKGVLLSAVILVMLFCFYPPPVGAHQGSVGFSDISVGAKTIRYKLDLPADSMEELVGIDRNRNGKWEPEEADAGKEMMQLFVSDFLHIKSGEMEGHPAVLGLGITERGNHPMMHVSLEYLFDSPITGFTIEYHVFFDGFDPGHQNLASISSGVEERAVVFDQRNRTFSWKTDGTSAEPGKAAVLIPSWLQTAWVYIKMGMEHIWAGYDHLLFLFGLLLSKGSKWDYLKMLTAFTAGHSITLALSVLEMVTVPVGIVEPLIALSLIYVAVENIWRKNLQKRWLVTFLFGLVHGFGFADLLRGNLVADYALSLFSFNLGVELGQVAVLLLIIPFLWLLRKYPLQSKVTWSLSGLIVVIGMYWFFERVAV